MNAQNIKDIIYEELQIPQEIKVGVMTVNLNNLEKIVDKISNRLERVVKANFAEDKKPIKTIVNLDDKVKEKLTEAVEIWADTNLIGKPAILANMLYFSLEKEFIKTIKGINEQFPK